MYTVSANPCPPPSRSTVLGGVGGGINHIYLAMSGKHPPREEKKVMSFKWYNCSFFYVRAKFDFEYDEG